MLCEQSTILTFPSEKTWNVGVKNGCLWLWEGRRRFLWPGISFVWGDFESRWDIDLRLNELRKFGVPEESQVCIMRKIRNALNPRSFGKAALVKKLQEFEPDPPAETIPKDPGPEPEFNYKFRNDYGCLRVALVRKYLWDHPAIEPVCRAYGEWVDTDEWLQLSMKMLFADNTSRTENVFVPCVKRGNDLYQARVNKRIAAMGDFKDRNIAGARNNLKTNVLLVTLTQDTKRFGGQYKYPWVKAWQTIGKEYNAWASAIRQKFGKFAEFRVWESSEEGFPHVHALIKFEKKTFRGFMHNNKMRIREKAAFASPWHSFVDVQGVTNFKRGMSEILKYLTKDIGIGKKKKAFLNSPKGRKTLALCWFFNKRAFAVSGFFRDLTTDLHNSNMVAVMPRFFQSDLLARGVVGVEFELIDIVPWKIVCEMGGDG